MNVLWTVLWKDLVCEWRSRDRVVAMLVFSMLVVMIFHFALPTEAAANIQVSVPGLLWIAYVFAALLGLNRSFALELENDALSGMALAPVERGWIFLGKAAANFILLALVQLVTACVFGLVFHLELASIALELAGVVALGSLGVTTLGTLFAAVSVRTRFREVMLPLLLLPLLMPVLIGAVGATSALLRDGSVPFHSIQLLIVTDVSYLIISFLGFEHILDE